MRPATALSCMIFVAASHPAVRVEQDAAPAGPPAQVKKIDEATLRKLVAQLGADYLEERESAYKALQEAGAQAESFLADALGSADFRVRRACLMLLAAHKSVRAVAKAADLLKTDADGSVRDAAFDFLRKAGKDAEDPLIDALSSDRAAHRLGAVQALQEMKSEKCAARMADLYNREQDKEIKDNAFKCLQSIGKAAEPFLVGLLASADPAVRQGALQGLKAAQGDDIVEAVGRAFVAESDERAAGLCDEHLSAAGLRAESHYLKGLRSAQDIVRLKSIEGLKNLRSEKAIDPAAECLEKDSSERVRQKASELLALHGLKSEGPLLGVFRTGNMQAKLLAIKTLGEIRSEKPHAEIARMFREDKDPEVHAATFAYLKALGAKAERDLLHALGDPNKVFRRQAIEALGLARSPAAVGRLIDFMAEELNSELQEAAEVALGRIGPPAIEAVARAVAAGTLKEKTASTIRGYYEQEEVERQVDLLITEGAAGRGFYEGQFVELAKFGKDRVVPVLLRMVREPGYRPRLEFRKRSFDELRREISVMALGELGDAGVKGHLLEAFKALPPDTDELREEFIVALHRLGEKEPLEEFIKETAARVQTEFAAGHGEEGCRALFSLGLVQNRVGRRSEAEAAYSQLVREVEERKIPEAEAGFLGVALYNLACLNALKGEKSRAIEFLRKAVAAGFSDRDWIEKDGDLKTLRGGEDYKKLLADDALFNPKRAK